MITFFIYVDPTSSQFSYIHDDIPDYYISTDKPKWYYPDDENPAWKGITKKINSLIRITRKINGNKVHYGIIEFIQYEIWGIISDLIRSDELRKREFERIKMH